MEVGGARVLRSDGSRGGGRGDASSYRHTAISAREKCQLSLLLLQPEAISLTQNAYKRLATGRARRGMLQCSPDPLAGFRGPLCGREGTEKRRMGGKDER